MGFNISGIAIDANYQDKFEDLQNDLNVSLEYIEDVAFETASANWTNKGIAFVYFGSNTTLLFLNAELCTQPNPISGKKTLTFVLSETSMAFSLNYCEGETIKRSIMEHEGRKIIDEGSAFSFEGDCNDSSEIIWTKLDDILGTSYHSIDLAAQAVKFKVSYGRGINEETDSKYTEQEDPLADDETAALKAKYQSFTNDQIYAEYRRIVELPDANSRMDCLISVAMLQVVGNERGITVSKPPTE